MSETPTTKRKPLWLYFIGGALLLVVATFLLVGNGLFLKSVVLPRVASQLNSDITADDISFSPFSSISIRGLKVVPKGDEPLFAAKEIRARYRLFAILGGTITLDEVLIDTPQVTLVQRSATDSNLAKLTSGSPKSAPTAPATKSAAPKIDIRNVSIKDGLFRLTDRGQVMEVSGLNFGLDQLQNGGSGKLTLTGSPKFQKGADLAAGAFKASFDIAVTPELLPASIKGGLELAADQAVGAFKEFARLGATLQMDLSPSEVRQLQLVFKKEGQAFGTVQLNGTLALEKKEARLSYEIQGLDRRILGLVGAASGLDVGQTQVSAKGSVDLAQQGQLVASKGRLSIDRFSLATTNGVTPTLDMGLDYQVSVNLEAQNALVQQVDFAAKQQGVSLVSAGLDRPMNLAFGKGGTGFRESTFSMSITNLNLADWKAFLGTNGLTGVLATDVRVQADQDGRLLRFTVLSAVDNLGLLAGTNRIDRTRVTANVKGSLGEFKAASIEAFGLNVERLGQAIINLSGMANYHLDNGGLAAQASGEVELANALGLYPIPSVGVAAGKLKFNGQIAQNPPATNFSTTINLIGFTGRVGDMNFRDYAAGLQVSANYKDQLITIQKASATAQTGYAPGGTFDLDGRYDLAGKRGEFNFKSTGLSQSALGPLVAAALQPNELKSIDLDFNGKASLDLAGTSSVAAELKVSKLIVEDPTGRLPKTPLSAGIGMDVSMRGQTIDLKKLLLSLDPTARASNQLLLSGKVDLAPTNASPSSLKLQSDGLDLTTYYDLFAGTSATTPEASPKPTAPVVPDPQKDPNREPDPIALPFKKLAVDVQIGRLYLRDVAITNWIAKADIQEGTVALNPFSLNLNGAPVSGSIQANLGVPGYRYELLFDAKQIPVAPLAKSFGGGEKVLLNGAVSAKTQIKGAGITGSGLRQNLAGSVELSASGLDYQVELSNNRFVKNVLVPVLVTVLKIPNIGQSPLQSVSAKAVAGAGNLDISELKILSPAFTVEGNGRIQIANILSNSPLEIPVRLAMVKDGKAEPLPDFLTVVGTVGAPKTKFDPLGLAKLATRLPGGVGELVGGRLSQATNVVNKLTGGLLGNILGGKNTNAAASVPGAATNKPAAQPQANPLDALRGLLPKKKP
jgi:uncharacterized protein involved in outer membrane biogenesis